MWLACVLQAQRQPAQTLVVLINGLNDMLHSFLMHNLFCLIFLFSFVFILYFEKKKEFSISHYPLFMFGALDALVP